MKKIDEFFERIKQFCPHCGKHSMIYWYEIKTWKCEECEWVNNIRLPNEEEKKER